jgi:hypothetical protein
LLDEELYLRLDVALYLRIKSFVKFRCSSHKLGIILGRHMGIPRDERVCIYCFKYQITVVEDEFCECKKYSQARDLYLGNV